MARAPMIRFTLTPACNICHTSMGYAALMLPPQWHYVLTVSPSREDLVAAIRVVGEQAGVIGANPLAPTIGLEIDDGYPLGAWSLSTADKSAMVWCDGVA